jgi:hypothetical protein
MDIYEEDVFIKTYPAIHTICKEILDKEGSGWYFGQCYFINENETEIQVDYVNEKNEDRSALFVFDEKQKLIEIDLNNID